MIPKRLFAWLLVGSCIALTACSHNRAQAPEAMVDPVVPLASITLLPIDPPEALFTDNRGVPVFGAVVTGIANTIMDKYKSDDFNTQHQAYRQKIGKKLTEALRHELQAQGFTVRLASRNDISRNDQDDMNLRAFANHDAMLDVQVSEVAMCSRRLRFDYQPMITGSFSLVKPRNGDYMTGSWFSYGTYATYTGDGYIQSSPRFSFPSFDALMSQPALAEESFDEGIQKIAANVADEIRKQYKPVARPAQLKEEVPPAARSNRTEPENRKKRS